MEQPKQITQQEYERLKKIRKKQLERMRRNEEMVVNSREKRDIWIGHKLGNVITDVKIGGKVALTEAFLIQSCKSLLPT